MPLLNRFLLFLLKNLIVEKVYSTIIQMCGILEHRVQLPTSGKETLAFVEQSCFKDIKEA